MKTIQLNQNGLLTWVGSILLLLVVSTAQAQPYAIGNATVSNGSDISSGGQYTLSGTIAQPASDPASSGRYGLASGFWSVVILMKTPDAPVLGISRNGNQIILSWPAGTDAFALQETESLNDPVIWTTLSAKPVIDQGIATLTLPVTGGLRFFRLQSIP